MRIDIYNSMASQLSSDSTPAKVNQGGVQATGSEGPEDRTTLTSGSSSVDRLIQAALNTPSVRADKIASLQQAISSGTYQIDPVAIAGSMIDEHA